MKALVVYYSNTGNNKYLAQRLCRDLKCDIEEIRPRMGPLPFQIFFSLIKASPGVKAPKHDVKSYDRVILCGPIWMGKIASPVRVFVKKYGRGVKKLYFATCCGSSDEKKNDKFGYATVFPQVKALVPKKRIHCEAFPIGLVVPDDKKEDNDAMMKARLSDTNFTGKIQKRLDAFVQKINEK